MIEPGCICFLVGLADGKCERPHGSSLNGHIVTVLTAAFPHAKAAGGYAHEVSAGWLAGTRLAVIPQCLRVIAPPPATPIDHRQEETA